MSQSSIFFGKARCAGFLAMRRRDHGQPVAAVPARAPPEMGQLDHDRGAVLVALVRQGLHPGHDLVLEGEDVVEHRRTVARDRGRPGGHGQGDAALRALDVIGAIALLRHPVLGVRRLVRGRHEAISQRQVLELKRLKKRICGHLEFAQGRRRQSLTGDDATIAAAPGKDLCSRAQLLGVPPFVLRNPFCGISRAAHRWAACRNGGGTPW